MSDPNEPEPGAPEPEEEPLGEPADPIDPIKRDDEPPGPDPLAPPLPPE